MIQDLSRGPLCLGESRKKLKLDLEVFRKAGKGLSWQRNWHGQKCGNVNSPQRRVRDVCMVGLYGLIHYIPSPDCWLHAGRGSLGPFVVIAPLGLAQSPVTTVG